MENRSHALAAGLFVLVLGLALGAVSLWFGKKDDRKLVPYVISTMSDVSGLKSEAPVRYRGVDVGRVQSIQLDPANRGAIEIRLGINEATPVTSTTYAQLGYLGVTGITFVSLQDKGTGGELIATSQDKPGLIPMKPSLMDSGETLLGSVGELVDRASLLLDEENRGTAKRLLANAERATDRVVKVAEQLEPATRELPAVVTDAKGMIADARSMMVAVRGAAGKADEMTGTINALALRIDSKLDTLTRVAANADDVGQAARVIQDETIPRLNALTDGLTREARALDRVIQTLNDQPQSIVFGNAPPRAGPGEPGYQGGSK